MILNNKEKTYYTIVVLCIISVLILSFFSINSLKKDYFSAIGQRALSIAIVTADSIKISNLEVIRLEEMEFNELLNDPINIKFEQSARKFMEISGIKYIYIMRRLSPDRIKYTVNTEEIEYFGVPEGTELDTIYLMDAVIDNETRLEDTDNQWYSDKDRYTVLNPDISNIYMNKKMTYAFYKDEWGSYLTGFAPVYSIEGDYIGILGVDIFLEEYTTLVNKRLIILLIMNIISVVMGVIIIDGIRRFYKTKADAYHFKQKSYLDDMTDLLNRRTLKERSKEYWKKAFDQNISITVVMLDIDYFKAYNDKYGHIIGDELISKVASAMKLCTRENEDMLFRYGGDEFMILFFDTDMSTIQLIIKRIREHTKSIWIKGVNERVTLSFGIASTMPKEGMDLTQLIQKADKALYLSKQKGRDCIHIYSTD